MANFACSALHWKPTWIALILLLVGCDKGSAPLVGEVTYDGKPLESGSIVFMPNDGVGPSRGTTISAGKFQLDSSQTLLPGKKIIQVSGAVKTGRQIEAPPPSPPGIIVDETRYIDFPPQELEVVAGKMAPLSIEFDLPQSTSARSRK